MNVIKQIIKEGEYGTQTIKMIVRSNERGPKGDKGEKGDAATLEAGNVYSIPEGQNPQVINTGTSSDAVFDFYLPKGPKGDDGAIHYTAGTGINITAGNVIEATGASAATWGGIQGDIDDQTDLQTALQNTASTAETASKNYTDTQLAGYAKTTDIPTVNNATLTIQNNGTNVATFTANSATNTTANIVPPVQIGPVLSTPTDVDYVNTANIVDGAVTTPKIANGAVTASNINWATLGIGTQVSTGSFSVGSNYDYTTTDPCWLVFSVNASGGAAAEVNIVMNEAIILNAFSNGGGNMNFMQRDTLFIPKGAAISCRVFGSGISGTGTFYKAIS